MIRRQRERPASKSAYTLVEMLVVITVLALVSAAIAPSLLSMQKSADRRECISGIKRVAAVARERAVQNGLTTQVVYDDSNKQLQVQDVDDQGNATTINQVTLRGGIEPDKFQVQGKDSNASDFKLTFTADGHSNGGGIEFEDFSILVDSNGFSKYMTGALPDPLDQEWQAGDLEQRT